MSTAAWVMLLVSWSVILIVSVCSIAKTLQDRGAAPALKPDL